MAVTQIATLTQFVTTSVNAVGDLNADLAAIRNQFNSLVTASNTLISGLTIPSPTITGTLVLPTLTQDLLFTDALYDIGKTGATRPRDIFTSRNATIGGTLSVSGNVISDLLFTDALYDIGKTGATRPRDGFFSRNFTLGSGTGSPSVTINGAPAGTANSGPSLFLNYNGINYCTVGSEAAFLGGGSVSQHIAIAARQSLNFYPTNGLTAILSLTSTGATVTGLLTMATAISQIIPGATSLSLRNNANSADNLLITDAGLVKMRNNQVFSQRNNANTQDLTCVYTDTTDTIAFGNDSNAAGVILGSGTKKLGFFASAGAVKGTVSGSRGANAALASLLTLLASHNLLVDSSS